MTLTFVPKLLALVVAFWASMSFMTTTIVSYFHDNIIPLVAGG
jgi:flagellar biosynthetic protein FliQ